MDNFLSRTDVEINSATVKQIGELAQALVQLREDISIKELDLERLKEKENQLSGKVIPDLLKENGIDQLSLASGQKIKVDSDLKITMPKTEGEKRTKAMSWIRTNGGEGIIKESITVTDTSEDIKKKLVKEEISHIVKEDVNTNTLKSFLKGLLGIKKGSVAQILPSDIPDELNPYMFTKTKIEK